MMIGVLPLNQVECGARPQGRSMYHPVDDKDIEAAALLGIASCVDNRPHVPRSSPDRRSCSILLTSVDSGRCQHPPRRAHLKLRIRCGAASPPMRKRRETVNLELFPGLLDRTLPIISTRFFVIAMPRLSRIGSRSRFLARKTARKICSRRRARADAGITDMKFIIHTAMRRSLLRMMTQGDHAAYRVNLMALTDVEHDLVGDA